MEPIARAVEIVGGQTKLARKIGGPVRQAHVWNWLNKGTRVPAEHCIAIERATAGEVSRYELRPDVFGPSPEQEAA